MTNKKINGYLSSDLLDFVDISSAVSGGARIKAGMLTRIVGDEPIVYPDVIDLLTSVQKEVHLRSDRDLNVGRRFFAPMQLNTFLHAVENRYRNADNQQTPNRSNYVTIGYGLFYHRTSMVIEEDDNYFYVKCSFDLYIDNRLTTARAGALGINDESCLINQATLATRPTDGGSTYAEDDTQLIALVSRLTGRQTNRNNQRYGYNHMQNNLRVPNTEPNRNQLSRFLIRSRFPLIRETAMSKIRVPNALHSCVAINKKLRLTKKKDNANSNINTSHPWFLSSRFTSAIREGRLMDHSKEIDYSLHTVGDGVTDKRHTMRFVGFMSENNRYLVANIISTDEVPVDLTALLKQKVNEKTYPKTKSKRLLSVNALLATYTTDEFKDEILDISTVLPDKTELTLVRVGDPEVGRAGDTLSQYCAIADGVYEINISTPSWLRRDKKKMKIEPGRYAVCVPRDETDLLKYNSIVGKSLNGILVEPVKTRLTMTKGTATTKTVVTARKSVRARLFSTDVVSSAESTDEPKKSVRSSRAGNIFGKSKKKKK